MPPTASGSDKPAAETVAHAAAVATGDAGPRRPVAAKAEPVPHRSRRPRWPRTGPEEPPTAAPVDPAAATGPACRSRSCRSPADSTSTVLLELQEFGLLRPMVVAGLDTSTRTPWPWPGGGPVRPVRDRASSSASLQERRRPRGRVRRADRATAGAAAESRRPGPGPRDGGRAVPAGPAATGALLRHALADLLTAVRRDPRAGSPASGSRAWPDRTSGRWRVSLRAWSKSGFGQYGWTCSRTRPCSSCRSRKDWVAPCPSSSAPPRPRPSPSPSRAWTRPVR